MNKQVLCFYFSKFLNSFKKIKIYCYIIRRERCTEKLNKFENLLRKEQNLENVLRK